MFTNAVFYIYLSLNKVHGTSILFTCNSIVHVSEPSNFKVKFYGGRNMVSMVCNYILFSGGYKMRKITMSYCKRRHYQQFYVMLSVILISIQKTSLD